MYVWVPLCKDKNDLRIEDQIFGLSVCLSVCLCVWGFVVVFSAVEVLWVEGEKNPTLFLDDSVVMMTTMRMMTVKMRHTCVCKKSIVYIMNFAVYLYHLVTLRSVTLALPIAVLWYTCRIGIPLNSNLWQLFVACEKRLGPYIGTLASDPRHSVSPTYFETIINS